LFIISGNGYIRAARSGGPVPIENNFPRLTTSIGRISPRVCIPSVAFPRGGRLD